jgi:hypothetical protein
VELTDWGRRLFRQKMEEECSRGEEVFAGLESRYWKAVGMGRGVSRRGYDDTIHLKDRFGMAREGMQGFTDSISPTHLDLGG